MNEDGYWIERVLTKLHSLYLGGHVNYEASHWDCDWDTMKSPELNIENCNKEIVALEKLANIGAIKIDLIANTYKDDLGKREITTGEAKYLDWLPILTGFDYEKFAEYCRLISFNPKLKSANLPKVEVDLGNGFRVHDRNIISYKNREVKLSPQKAKLIAYIMRNSARGQYTTNNMIVMEVYSNSSSERPDAEIRRVISEVRSLLRSVTGKRSTQFIRNKPGVGYMFVSE